MTKCFTVQQTSAFFVIFFQEGAIVTALLTLPLKQLTFNPLSWNGHLKVNPLATLVKASVDN